MRKPPTQDEMGDIRPEYDFTGGTRGKYATRYAEGTNLVLLDADVAEAFPSAEAVNRAVRPLIAHGGEGEAA